MNVEIVFEDDRWQTCDLDLLAERVVTVLTAELDLRRNIGLSLLASSDARLTRLNATFRGKPTPTNVLSWPTQELRPPQLPRPDPDGAIDLGDIALGYETCAREARDQGKSLANHTTHLIVHGILHLLGYDHLHDDEAIVMENLEVRILGKLGLPDPYDPDKSQQASDADILERNDGRH